MTPASSGDQAMKVILFLKAFYQHFEHFFIWLGCRRTVNRLRWLERIQSRRRRIWDPCQQHPSVTHRLDRC